MNELIFGKDPTQRVVAVEPSFGGSATLFIQNDDGEILQMEVPQTHWIIYKEHLSPKMQVLEGNQPYKYLVEYDNFNKYLEVLQASREKEIDTYVCRDLTESFLIKTGVTLYKGLKVKDVSVLSFDLEHTYGIGDKLRKDGKLLLISNTFRDSFGAVTKKLFAFDSYESEADMIHDWCRWVRQMDPSNVIGHNIFGHDFKILKHAANRYAVKLRLGRDGSEIRFDNRKSSKRKDGSQSYDFINCHIYGREIIDTFFLALNFDIARNYESYALKAIIDYEINQLEIKKKKEPHKYTKADEDFLLQLTHNGKRTFYDASTILKNHNIPEEWAKIKAYAIDDADDSLSLYDLMIAPFFYATRSIPRSFQHVINSASGSQINGMMVRGYLQQNHSIAEPSDAVSFEGAISFAIPGLHKNVQRFDVASLYPSIIRQHRIFHPGKDPQELLLQMVDYFTDERLLNKKLAKDTGNRDYKDLSEGQKIIINSMYGFMGANRLNYNYPPGAAEVTRIGRETLKTAILFITGQELDLDKLAEEEDEDEDE